MRDRRLHALIVGLLLAAPLSSCHRSRQDEWSVPLSASARHVAGAAPLSARRGPASDPLARGLFAKNCATCHGLDGSGQGPSVLDRPARNFKDGGFSFGNTADAIFNTISHGIPGTPMPAFGESLDEGQRHLLAAYVRTLGPPVENVDVEDTILHVTEETGPLIVRGILPPIVEGAPIRPRGMLVGLPGGLTFEYRIDDVRLLGVRQGGFVERTDWNDRGGTPLKPLGGLIWTDSGGTPPATFTAVSNYETVKTVQQLVGAAGNTLHWRLVTDQSLALADVEEQLFPSRRGSLSGFAQSTRITGGGQPMPLALHVRIAVPPGGEHVATVEPAAAQDGDVKIPGNTWQVFRRPDGVYECIGTLTGEGRFDAPPTLTTAGDTIEAILVVPERNDRPPHLTVTVRLVVHHLFATAWNEAVRAQLQERAD